MNKYKPKKIITIVFSAVLFICAGFGAAADSGLYTAELFGGMIACRTNPDISVAAPAAENAPYVIAIDPGHGGMDTGAQRLMDEVDICDKTAGYLYRMLENDENFTPMLTRDTDSFPSPMVSSPSLKMSWFVIGSMPMVFPVPAKRWSTVSKKPRMRRLMCSACSGKFVARSR